MKPFFNENFGKRKLGTWVRLVGITGSTQFLIQGIGLLSGILVIRWLPTEEYALYTLANTILGTMVVLADSGIATGVTAEGGKVWKEKSRLGSVLVTGMNLRKKFAIGSLLIAAPILLYLLNFHGADWWMAVLIFLALIPAFMSALTGAIFMIPLKLHQDIKPLQKNLLMESLGRFGLIFSLAVFPFSFVAILCAGIPRAIANIRLYKISTKFADWRESVDAAIRKRILGVVKRLMPGAVYYCISGQISIYLISIFGSTTNVAEIGALGRISVALTLISTLFGTLIYPRFARLEEDHKLLLKRFFQITSALFFVCTIAVLAIWALSTPILWVLGDAYSDLGLELVLSATASCIGLISGGVFTMSSQRSWVMNPALSIPVSIGAIVAGALIMDVTTLLGVLQFNIFVVSVQLLLNSGYFFFRWNKSYQLKLNE